MDRHTSTGRIARQSGIKDLFPESISPTQIENAVKEAYSNIKVRRSQGDRVLGTGVAGGMIIEMWVNKATKVIETAYPKRMR
ncbi:EndoU domain-containing protein [Chania multitudinisentens]|uniref:EndoU domain-containing protein n=1 Tax=Chania multitudinisentens TaxID=1639108 RepID=UPI0009007591